MSDIETLTRKILADFDAFNVEAISNHFDDTFVQQLLPTSLGSPSRNKEEYTQWLTATKPAVAVMKVDRTLI